MDVGVSVLMSVFETASMSAMVDGRGRVGVDAGVGVRVNVGDGGWTLACRYLGLRWPPSGWFRPLILAPWEANRCQKGTKGCQNDAAVVVHVQRFSKSVR